MRVSFIIPLYNCLPLTQAMLESLQATLPADLAHEIILIDDGSTDGTREWLTTVNHPAIRVLLNERNLGYAATNNRAVASASGELLVLLNNDLVLTPGWLEPMLAVHRSLPKPGAIGNIQLNANTGAIDHAGIYVTVKGKPEHDVTPSPCAPACGNSSCACSRPSPAVTGACLLIARELWQQLGGFDEQFHNGGEDIDLCFRARKAGYANAVALRSVIRHHVSASPGRKQNDERNSYLFTQRWEKELIELGALAWCRHHVRHEAYRDFLALPTILFYLAGLRRTPPAAALRGVKRNIDHSLSIWTKAFGAAK
ncbi:MAG: glycosyltransferase family 2 protein [Verrucomicrobia bacterium]|nr:glycosyltransferase family 2 protein [Verrucomicrobiota bacterium]